MAGKCSRIYQGEGAKSEKVLLMAMKKPDESSPGFSEKITGVQ
ncbi:hypothetical protein GPEL0_01f0006 [Geoanaerobacter pelophilus]|uniref:Uncharacterized protein n=1 Tax=Geoanaerobacter pelophilus TaxID=60036 RepID=A0ABQ0MDN8_9BACT|nr:hypothetical protein GPEL0_01f0006 [Geoanaerobacter pelophilus]